MKHRGIGEREVINAINRPDQTGLPVPRFRDRKHNSWNRSAKTTIHVIFEELEDHFRVVAVYDVTSEDARGREAGGRKRGRPRQRKPKRRGRKP